MAVFGNLSVNTNVPALTAQTNLSRSSARLNVSLERLSTGLKINSSADNPSGLVISEFQRAQISGLRKAIDNVDRAISLVQTSEGGLSEINALLIELRSLTIDSANNGALDNASLDANQANVKNLIATVDRIATNTRFGTFNLLDGSSGISGTVTNDEEITFLKADNNDRFGGLPLTDPRLNQRVVTSSGPFEITTTRAIRQSVGNATNLGAVTTIGNDETLIINGISVDLQAGLNRAQIVERINEFSGQTGATAFVEQAGDLAIRQNAFGKAESTGGTAADLTVFSNRGDAPIVGGPSAGFEFINKVGTAEYVAGVELTGTFKDSTGAAAFAGRVHGNVLIGDPDSTARGIAVQINVDVGTTAAPSDQLSTHVTVGATDLLVVADNSRSFQIGAFGDKDLLVPQNRSEVTLNRATSDGLAVGLVGNQFSNLKAIDVRSVSGANDAILIIDKAIEEIATQRGTIGAFQKNTLETTQSNLRTQLVNLEEAESVLRDTDFTSEITAFTAEQIRQQASTTVLGLANQSALAILGLLQSGQ